MSSQASERGRWTIITPNLSKGPFSKIASALAVALVSRGTAVDVLYLEHHGRPIRLPDNVSTRPLRGQARYSVPQIASHLRERKPAVVVSISFLMNVPCLIASRLVGYRGTLLVSEHSLATSTGIADYPKGFSRLVVARIYNTLYMWAHSIVCVSESVEAALEDLPLSDRVRQKLTVIANPVALDNSLLSSDVELPFEPDEEPLFLSLGRLVPRKRADLSIAAFSLFFARNRVGYLLIAGEGPEEPNLRRLARQLGIEGRVHLLGYVKNSAILLSKATFLLHLAHSEAFGLVVAEALTVGTPAIVAQGSGGPEELIGEGGLAVPPDPLSVSAAMDDIWNDKSKLRNMRIGALVAAKQVAPELVADKWLALAKAHVGSRQ